MALESILGAWSIHTSHTGSFSALDTTVISWNASELARAMVRRVWDRFLEALLGTTEFRVHEVQVEALHCAALSAGLSATLVRCTRKTYIY
jgi:hypothetical protein